MVTITYPTVAKPVDAESIFTLRGVTWPTYKALMADVGDGRPWRIAYDGEILELRMPLLEHETPKILIDHFVATTADEMEIEMRAAGALSGKRRFNPCDRTG